MNDLFVLGQEALITYFTIITIILLRKKIIFSEVVENILQKAVAIICKHKNINSHFLSGTTKGWKHC